MKETVQSGDRGGLTLDYVDPRLDRRLQGCLTEAAIASQRRRYTGICTLFLILMVSAAANEFTHHFHYGLAVSSNALALVATWLWARRCWEARYRIAAHITIASVVATLLVLPIFFGVDKLPIIILYACPVAAGSWLLLGLRPAIFWTLFYVTIYPLYLLAPADMSVPSDVSRFGNGMTTGPLMFGAAIMVVWAIDRQRRSGDEFALVSDFERNAEVRLNCQYRLAEAGRKTAAMGQVVGPMLQELADIAEDACRFVGRLAARTGEHEDFIDDLKISWDSIQRNSARASSVAQMMTRSDIDRQSPVTDQLIDLGSLVDEQAKVLAAGLKVEGSTHVEICADLDHLPSTLIAGDYNALATMVQCLITNAVDSVKEKAEASAARFDGVVRITGRVVGAEAEIKVIDNGVGIDPSKGDAYFEPFYTTKPPTSGRAGLGLPTARATLVEIGGDLTLEPEPEHGGAVATAVIPVVVSTSKTGNRPPVESPRPVASPPPQPPDIADTDAAFAKYRTDRYRVASVLAALQLVAGFGFANGQKVWLVILAILAVVLIASWTWFEGNPGARFNIASRVVTYSLGLAAITLAIAQGTASEPLRDMLLSDFPAAMMLVSAVVVGYGFAGRRLAVEVALPVLILGLVGLMVDKPFTPQPNAIDPSLALGGSTMLIPFVIIGMFMPHTFSLALHNMRRSQALLEESRAARLELSQAETAAALGRVSSGVLHEVANPLNFTKNFAQVIIDSFAEYDIDPAAYRDEFDIYDAAVRSYELSTAINERLDSLRLSASADEPSPVDHPREQEKELAIR